MQFLEKDLEDIIYESDREALDKRGLFIDEGSIMKRQLRIGNYGVADLVTFRRDFDWEYDVSHRNKDNEPVCCIKNKHSLIVTIYELKKGAIGLDAFMQAVRYAKGIKRYLQERGFGFKVKFNIVLIGNRLNVESGFLYLEDIVSSPDGFNLDFLTYDYKIDGIHFKSERYYTLIDEGFGI